MTGTVLAYLIIVLVWVGFWGCAEMFVDKISNGNKKKRLLTYITFVIFGIVILALIGAFSQ